MPRGKVFIFSGISGVGIRHALTLLADLTVEVLDLDSAQTPKIIMLEDHLDAQPYLDELQLSYSWSGRVSDAMALPKPVLRRLWIEAFEAMLAKVEDECSAGRDTYVHFHACWHQLHTIEFFSPVRPSYLSRLGAGQLVTLEDDIFDVYSRLRLQNQMVFPAMKETPAERITEVIDSLLNLLRWRALEFLVSEHIANDLSIPQYILAVKHPVETLFRMLYHPSAPRLYLSHPISEPRRLSQAKTETEILESKAIIDSISRISGHLASDHRDDPVVLFEPTAIDEYRFAKFTHQADDLFVPRLLPRWNWDRANTLWALAPEYKLFEEAWPRVSDGFAGSDSLDLDDARELIRMQPALRSIIKTIIEQISWRDHKLVEQSNALAVYRPIYRGNPSRGVREELLFFRALHGQEPEKYMAAYVYCPAADLRMHRGYNLGRTVVERWERRGALVSNQGSETMEEIIEDLRSGDFASVLLGTEEGKRIATIRGWLNDRGMEMRVPPEAIDQFAHAMRPGEAAALQEWLSNELTERLSPALTDQPYIFSLESVIPKVLTVHQDEIDEEEFALLARKYVADRASNKDNGGEDGT